MRLLNTVIYTDRLAEVRTFYETNFYFPMDRTEPNSFGILPLPEAKITFVDAAATGMVPSQNILLRLAIPYPALEHARLVAAGVSCSELATEDWGSFYRQAVQCFTFTDPSGVRIQFFGSHFGEEKQSIPPNEDTGKVQSA